MSVRRGFHAISAWPSDRSADRQECGVVQQPVGAQKSCIAKEPTPGREIKRPAVEIRNAAAGFRYQERAGGTIPNGAILLRVRDATQQLSGHRNEWIERSSDHVEGDGEQGWTCSSSSREKLEVYEALIALFIAAMDANEHTVLTQCGQQVAPTNINADGATAGRIRR
jgi:hypothetical protein